MPLLIWAISKNKTFGKIVVYFWLGIFCLFIIGTLMNIFIKKTELSKKHYYGTYIVDRDFFKGSQADWQYKHYRFEINENDSIYFYETNNEKIVKTYTGTITTTNPKFYDSDRLIIKMDQPTHHILTSNPTTVRSAWSFYLVFNSPKFNNVFFKKRKWEPIE